MPKFIPLRFRKALDSARYAIEAKQWTNTDSDREAFADWFDEHDQMFVTNGDDIVLDTSDGDIQVAPGDWIIAPSDDEYFKPMSATTFARNFEAF